MFMDDASETWDSSEFQDSFIKDYFGKRKVSKQEAKDELNSVDQFENYHSIKVSKDVFQGSCGEDGHGKWSLKCDLNKPKHTLNSSVKENVKKKRKLSDNSSQENCIKNHKTNIDIKKIELDTSKADSNSLKSKKKRKRKNKNKHVTEDEMSLDSSHHETLNQIDRNEGKKQKFSNSSDNYIKNHEINSDLDTMELDFPIDDSNSLKPKKKRKQKLKNRNKVDIKEHSSLTSSHCETPMQINNDIKESPTDEETDAISNHSSEKKSLFQSKLSQKLQAAKFRYLNEMLYTNTGKDALVYFQENTDEFQDYHVGYQSQVSKWPINPVDIIIEELSQMNKQNVIADLGCGEAKISEVFPKRTVHSFDLIAVKDCVTACDMANVPLPNKSVDVVVFCLSLMGTNWKDYLRESHRLLKLGAVLKIAEIESRIDNVHDFVKNIEAHGFSLVNKDMSHKMFIFLNFKKAKNKVKTSKIPNVTLKPCLYKKR